MSSADGTPDKIGAAVSGAEVFARDTSMSHALRDTLLQLSSTETTETDPQNNNSQIEHGDGWKGSTKNFLEYFQKSLSFADSTSGQVAVSASAREKSDAEVLPQIADKSRSGSGSEDSFELVENPACIDERGKTDETSHPVSCANGATSDATAASTDAGVRKPSDEKPIFPMCNDETFPCVDKYELSTDQGEKSWTRKLSTSVTTCNNETLSCIDKYAPSSDVDGDKSWTRQLSTRAQGLYAAVASRAGFKSNQEANSQLVVAKDATATHSGAVPVEGNVLPTSISCNNEAFACLDKHAPTSEDDDKTTWTRQLSNRAQGLLATVATSASLSKAKGVATSNEGEEIATQYQGMEYYDMCNQSAADFSNWSAQMSSEASGKVFLLRTSKLMPLLRSN